MRGFVPWVVILVLVVDTIGGNQILSCSDNKILNSIKYQLGLLENNDTHTCSCKQDISKIAFLAKLQNHITSMSSGATVIFQTVITNEGSGYNPTTGIFTAPSTGSYFFTWSTLTKIGDAFITEIVLNGQSVGVRNHGVANNNSGVNHPSAQSAVVGMTTNDKVLIRTYGSTGVCFADSYTTFIGFKI